MFVARDRFQPRDNGDVDAPVARLIAKAPRDRRIKEHLRHEIIDPRVDFALEPLPRGLAGLPRRLHGRPLEEALWYRVAYAYEQTKEWPGRHPSL
jgi:hypothetical protein